MPELPEAREAPEARSHDLRPTEIQDLKTLESGQVREGSVGDGEPADVQFAEHVQPRHVAKAVPVDPNGPPEAEERQARQPGKGSQAGVGDAVEVQPEALQPGETDNGAQSVIPHAGGVDLKLSERGQAG